MKMADIHGELGTSQQSYSDQGGQSHIQLVWLWSDTVHHLAHILKPRSELYSSWITTASMPRRNDYIVFKNNMDQFLYWRQGSRYIGSDTIRFLLRPSCFSITNPLLRLVVSTLPWPLNESLLTPNVSTNLPLRVQWKHGVLGNFLPSDPTIKRSSQVWKWYVRMVFQPFPVAMERRL